MSVPTFSKPILLAGRENMNRAVQGDIVVVEMFNEKEWRTPAQSVVNQEGNIISPFSTIFFLLVSLFLIKPPSVMMIPMTLRKKRMKTMHVWKRANGAYFLRKCHEEARRRRNSQLVKLLVS